VSTEYLGSTTIPLQGMVVLDLNNQTVISLGPSVEFCINVNASIGDEQINGHHDKRKS
jgi:hypothetical protein